MSTGKMITEKMVRAKVVIPTKSRIAAWWMLIVGGIFGAIGLALLLGVFTGVMGTQNDLGGALVLLFALGGIAIFVVYFIPGLLVLKGGSRGWIWGSVILSIATSGLLLSGGPLSILPVLIPLVLILSDHVSYKGGGDTR